MEERDFFEAVLAASDDEDGPTLIYADWLEERGEAFRPTYIRTDVELNRLDEDDPEASERCFELRRRGKEAHLESVRTGEGRLPRLEGAMWSPPERGLVRGLWVEDVSSCGLKKEGPWKWAPVEHLTFDDPKARPREWANSKAVARAREIDWNYENGASGPRADFAACLTSPALSGLRRLSLNAVESDARSFDLRPDEGLPPLSSLEMEGHRLSAETAIDLLEGRLFPGLSSLGLESCRLSVEDQGAWARGLVLPNIETAWISDVGANAQWFSELGSWTAPKLGFFGASGARLQGQGLKDLLPWPVLKGIKSLVLVDAQIGLKGARALARAPDWGRLRHLGLAHNALTDAAVKALLKGPALENLTRLDLSHNPIGDEGALALADSPLVEKLLELDLSRTRIGREGGRALAAALPRSRLRRLDLRGTRASRDLEALGEGPIPKFERLVLGWGQGLSF